MLPEKYQWIGVQFEPGDGDPRLLFEIARALEEEGNLEGAATVYDRVYGLDPHAEDIREGRWRLLEQLAVEEYGLLFRYVPGGPFLMGSNDGDADECPWHPVWLAPFWVSETPISWAAYCRLMDWEPPPEGFPRNRAVPEGERDMAGFHLYEANKIRLQYCEDLTTRARGWHSHHPGQRWQSGNQTETAQEVFGAPQRTDPAAAWQYENKPMVAVAWQEAQELADRLSTSEVRYALPSEAQWEKAARGGLIGARYPWGDAPPTHELCDFDRFFEFSILPMQTFAANGYGLHAMSGSVWEWTRDWYDRDAYRHHGDRNPEGAAEGKEKVLRGGSWSDCVDVLRVSFRMSRPSSSWRQANWGGHLAPNIGFRLCCMVVAEGRMADAT